MATESPHAELKNTQPRKQHELCRVSSSSFFSSFIFFSFLLPSFALPSSLFFVFFVFFFAFFFVFFFFFCALSQGFQHLVFGHLAMSQQSKQQNAPIFCLETETMYGSHRDPGPKDTQSGSRCDSVVEHDPDQNGIREINQCPLKTVEEGVFRICARTSCSAYH